ncbi:hypothetical protein Bca101_025008 [Brassica carinata]
MVRRRHSIVEIEDCGASIIKLTNTDAEIRDWPSQNCIDQTHRSAQPHHHNNLRLLSLLHPSSSSRFFSDMSGSDSSSSLPVTLDSINPNVDFCFLSLLYSLINSVCL